MPKADRAGLVIACVDASCSLLASSLGLRLIATLTLVAAVLVLDRALRKNEESYVHAAQRGSRGAPELHLSLPEVP